MNTKFKIISAAIVILINSTANAQQFTEKYPVTIIPEPNVVSAYLRANFGKIGEIAAKSLDSFLNDPVKQAKMAAKAIEYIQTLHANSKTQDQKSNELIAKIEEEISSLQALNYISAKQGTLETQAAFSPQFNVVKLSWNADRPPAFNCQLYDSTKPFPNQFYNVTILQEADYKIYRNDKLIATLGGQNKGLGSKTQSVNTDWSGISIALSVELPKKPSPGVIVFYDYDPYQANLGTPVRYTVEAVRQGCSVFTNNSGPPTGANVIRTEFYLDSDGDSIPDFIPRTTVESLRRLPSNNYPPQATVTTSPSPLSRNVAGLGTYTVDVTANVTNGVAPYSYSWSVISSDSTNATVTNPTSATATLSTKATVSCTDTYATYRVAVTDAIGRVTAKDVPVKVKSTSPPSGRSCN